MKIVKLFKYNKGKSYDFFYNSNMSKRGVGILISTSLNLTVSNVLKDNDENILGVTVSSGTDKIRLFSIYGPNNNERSFFNSLADFLNIDPSTPVIIGGDWNATYSISDGEDNIDTFNMAAPPSATRSMWLNQLCRDFFLCDPFGALHPSERDFTFTPHGVRRNRSHIDFFIVGEELIDTVARCSISPSVNTILFDHKSIHLDFKNEKCRSKMYINRTIITNPRTGDIVAAAAADTYLHHATPGQQPRGAAQQFVFRHGHVDDIENQKVIVGNLFQRIKEYNDLKMQIETQGQDNLLVLQLAAKNTEITE
jgi:exonuclease III